MGEDARRETAELTDEQRAALIREQLKALRTVDVARDMMITLVTVGYQKLGLTQETRELRNLPDARLAIEMLRGIVEAVAEVAGEDPVTEFRSTLAHMQLQYARAASSGAEGEGEASAPPGAEDQDT